VKAKKVREELLRTWQPEIEPEKLAVLMVYECYIFWYLYKAILRKEQMKEEKSRLKMNLKDQLIIEPKIIKRRNLLCKN
jgi:hypothetical protein